MPRAHFACTRCNVILLVEYPMDAVGASGWPPSCDCGAPLEASPQAGDFKFDLRSDAVSDSRVSGQRQKFTIQRQVPQRDGTLRHVEEVIDSTHKMRLLEKESERRYANGEGEPIRFRAFSQDRSQMLESSFGTEGVIGGKAYDSGKAPAKKPNISLRRHGQERPRVPVARGAGQSPL